MKRIVQLFAITALLGLAPAYAQDASVLADAVATSTTLPVVEDPGSIVTYAVKAVKEGKWAWLVGLIFMMLTWVFNKILKERIPRKALPWIALGLGVGTNIAMSFANGMVWYEAISNGVSMGLAAVGGWSALGKHVFPTKHQKDKKAANAEAAAAPAKPAE